jgi:(p)ppGpp synthase/HD superfamily hydrolase
MDSDHLIVKQARCFGVLYHDNTYGNQPYVYHLDAVAYKVASLGGDVIAQTVAYLHDVLEDTVATEASIHTLFGKDIWKYVRILTKPKGTVFDTRQYNSYIALVKTDPVPHLVKIADTLCNLEECIRTNDNRRFKYLKQLQLLLEPV